MNLTAAGRKALIGRMAADLRRFDATNSERDAVRTLFGHYQPLEIALLAGDALYEARLSAVAEAMR